MSAKDTTRDWIIWGVSIGVTAAAAYVLYSDLWLARRRNEDDSEDSNEATLSECNYSLQSTEVKTDADLNVGEAPLFLRKEQFSRNAAFFGEKSQKKIEESFFVIFDVASVGSHCAHMLIRSGAARARVVDTSVVTKEGLSSSAMATHADVGAPHAVVFKRFCQAFAPHCRIDTVAADPTDDNIAELLKGDPDYVFDCTHKLETKRCILQQCLAQGTKAITTLGIQGQRDPTRIQIGDLTSITREPRARVLLRRMGWEAKGNVANKRTKRKDVKSKPQPIGVLGIYSSEYTEPSLDTSEFGPMACSIGLAMASVGLCTLAGKPVSCAHPHELSVSMMKKMHQKLKARERHRHNSRLTVSKDDLAVVVTGVWANRDSVHGHPIGAGSGFYLCRFDPMRAFSIDNSLLVSDSFPKEHLEMLQRHATGHGPTEELEILKEMQIDVDSIRFRLQAITV